jgi:ubiquinone/menaquinone biosynthesis C-methylase UbiE
VAEIVAVLRDLEPARTLDAMIEVAARQAPHARLVRGDAVPLPLADGEFGRLHTSHIYGHRQPTEREPFLAEARRVAARPAAELGGGEVLHDGRWFFVVRA